MTGFTEKCLIDGCECGVVARGWCRKHYGRWHRHGDPLAYPRKSPQTKVMRADGYCIVYRPGHVLATRGAYVYEHRLVLFGHLGPGTHPCHWCSTPVTWGDGLETDHIDGNPANNDLRNLVPSCHRCNVIRERKIYGTRNPASRLSESGVREIRAAASRGERQHDLAARFGVSQSTISSIVRRVTWKEVSI